ncbi:hypothetical protein CB1_000366002 [Camelus ferus]|nr:hypothetical protein CB1_000366002 [Camelus ferus]
MEGVIELKEKLLSAIRTYKPYGDLVHQTRILLLGPIGAGKSSFLNSVKSIFRGHVTNQALVGSYTCGTSDKYRTYFINDGKNADTLPFILCDSLGLSETEEGLCMGDIPYILKGHIADRYKLEAVHRELGFPPSNIFVVRNYTSEWELEPVMDVLILSALRHMLWAADDFLEDLPFEETDRCVW